MKMEMNSTIKGTHPRRLARVIRLFVVEVQPPSYLPGGDGYLGDRRGTVKQLRAASVHGPHAQTGACAPSKRPGGISYPRECYSA